MNTKQKIEALAKLYKQVARHGGDGIDIVQGNSVPMEDCEILLAFARSVASEYDRPMQELIRGFRAVLENEVHTAAGF